MMRYTGAFLRPYRENRMCTRACTCNGAQATGLGATGLAVRPVVLATLERNESDAILPQGDKKLHDVYKTSLLMVALSLELSCAEITNTHHLHHFPRLFRGENRVNSA